MRRIALLLLPLYFVLSAFNDFNCINLPPSPYNYANIIFPIDILNNLSEMDNMPVSNPTTDAGATLGRVLFYDADLSQNHTVSCASCHKQQFSFSDTARFSAGFNGGLTSRNSMNLNHARFQRDSAFFWDNRAASLELQVLMPIKSSVEMGLSLDSLVARVAAKSFYPPLFQSAFGSPAVDTVKIARALAQFVRSMNTFGSKFRQGVNITNGNPSIVPFSNFTAQENLGKDLFMDVNRGNCQSCHTRNVVVQQGAQNIGLDLVYSDNGVGAATGNANKNGKFSVPSLINVELTAPYMHDGRFATLEKVIDFYSDSVKPHVNLSNFLKDSITGLPRRPHYTVAEKQALITFLKTITDTTITTDVRWSNPFCSFTPSSTILNLKLFLQGFYTGGSVLAPVLNINGVTANTAVADTITVELHNSASPHTTTFSEKSILKTDGTCSINIPIALAGNSYYITIKHRSHLETWSKNPLIITTTGVSYDFSTGSGNAYGNNLANLGDGNFGLYAGDINYNGNIDMNDISEINNSIKLFLSGYLNYDLNGDKLVESADFSLIENNFGKSASRP